MNLPEKKRKLGVGSVSVCEGLSIFNDSCQCDYMIYFFFSCLALGSLRDRFF